MGKLRKPFFVAALIAIILALLVETGATFLIGAGTVSADAQTRMGSQIDGLFAQQQASGAGVDLEQIKRDLQKADKPPGLAIGAMALLDGLLVFTLGLVGVSLIIPERMHVKYQAVATLVAALLVLLAAVTTIFLVWTTLTIMLALFTAGPFGLIAYLAKWGYFDRNGATAALSVIMTCKLTCAGCLMGAHQRFLQNKGLILLILTSLVANVVIGILHGLLPVFLVSITDAIAALIVGIAAAIWAVVLLIGAVSGVIKLIL